MWYLVEPQLAVWSDNPSPTDPGTYKAMLFLQPGMVAFVKSGRSTESLRPTMLCPRRRRALAMLTDEVRIIKTQCCRDIRTDI